MALKSLAKLLACVAWRFLSKLTERAEKAESPRVRDPRGFAARFRRTEKPNRQARQATKLFNFVVCNPCQSSPSLTILVPLCIIIIPLVFFHFCKAFFFQVSFNLKLNLSRWSKYLKIS